MANNTKNFDRVPIGDRAYFLRATVSGLRAQLRELGLDSSGLKVDLYLRLTDEGHRLYTDDRDQSDDDQAGDDDGEDVQESSDQGSSDQGSSGQGSNGQGSSSSGGTGHKRHRNDGGDDSDGDDNDSDSQGPPPPPPRKIVRLGGAPVELQVQILANLTCSQLWNLAMAAPAGYLSDDLNAFLLDAQKQHRIDYPLVNSDDEGSGSSESGSNENGSNESGSNENGSNESGSNESGSSGSGSSGIGSSGIGSSQISSDDEDYDERPYRPLSLLQWVGWRLVYDPALGTTYRARILQLLDTYLQVYGRDKKSDQEMTAMTDHAIEAMLNFFRPEVGDGSRPPLFRAARSQRPDVVHLLLLRGEPVNQTIPSSTLPVTDIGALNLALTLDLDGSWVSSDAMHIIFALIGAGADVTLITASAKSVANTLARELNEIPIGHENSFRWPRIVNVRGLSVREFIADPRSDYFDRVRLAMYLIAFDDGEENYPGLE